MPVDMRGQFLRAGPSFYHVGGKNSDCKHDSNHLYPLNPLKNAVFALRQVFFPAGYADPEISSQVSPPTLDSDSVELQACTTLLCFCMRLGGKSHD